MTPKDRPAGLESEGDLNFSSHRAAWNSELDDHTRGQIAHFVTVGALAVDTLPSSYVVAKNKMPKGKITFEQIVETTEEVVKTAAEVASAVTAAASVAEKIVEAVKG